MNNMVVVTDIFGRSPALEKLCTHLQDYSSSEVEIIDPYNGKYIDFTDEQQAYQHFTRCGGVEIFAKILLKALTRQQVPIKIIAFSVGASALWSLSENNQLIHIKQANCFYGSQIRYYQNINPIFPIKLIFPAHENHFDVDKLQNNLVQKENVTANKTVYLHGFMNELSTNFNINAYNTCIGSKRYLKHK
ncbi:MAG: dienelactone hydrolase [Alteromonadaceae bacterium]|jgi:dienelactone hydrolase